MGPQCAAKQPGCRAKVISYSVLAWCHFGGKKLVWVLLTHGGKSICGDKVYMWIMMIGWHMFQVVSCPVIVIWLVSWCWKVNDAGGKWCWSTSASILQKSPCVVVVVVVVHAVCCCNKYCWWSSYSHQQLFPFHKTKMHTLLWRAAVGTLGNTIYTMGKAWRSTLLVGILRSYLRRR